MERLFFSFCGLRSSTVLGRTGSKPGEREGGLNPGKCNNYYLETPTLE